MRNQDLIKLEKNLINECYVLNEIAKLVKNPTKENILKAMEVVELDGGSFNAINEKNIDRYMKFLKEILEDYNEDYGHLLRLNLANIYVYLSPDKNGELTDIGFLHDCLDSTNYYDMINEIKNLSDEDLENAACLCGLDITEYIEEAQEYIKRYNNL